MKGIYLLQNVVPRKKQSVYFKIKINKHTHTQKKKNMPPSSSNKSALASRLAAKEKKMGSSFDAFEDDNDVIDAPKVISREEVGSAIATATIGNKLKKNTRFLPLQKRGPLSEDLTTGKYAAVVRGEESYNDDDEEDDMMMYSSTKNNKKGVNSKKSAKFLDLLMLMNQKSKANSKMSMIFSICSMSPQMMKI
jgi:hypothetical protein